MISVALFHRHYDEDHLGEVVTEMQAMGAPEIRAFWWEAQGVWLALEGCHRLRAAERLGITPKMIEVPIEGTVTIQLDGDDVEVDALELFEDIERNAHALTVLDFSS